MIQSLLRIEETKALSRLELNGKILDLGGEKNAYYHRIIQGKHNFFVVNLDMKTKPDLFYDLEKNLPFKEGEYEHVIIMNVLEHVYNFKKLIDESYRIVEIGGTIVVVVPFLFPFHASPRDFFRYTETSLKQILIDSGFKDINVRALGSGIFSVSLLCFDRLMPYPLRFINYYVTRHIVYFFDFIFDKAAYFMRKKYKKTDYALGYFVTAKKVL
jgi:SAM-dependent methyltransferase